MEKIAYDSLKSLCNIEMVKYLREKDIAFDDQRPLDVAILSQIVKVWNTRNSTKVEVFVVPRDGTEIIAICPTYGEPSKTIFIRQDRWTLVISRN
jgi:hypothetical protein